MKISIRTSFQFLLFFIFLASFYAWFTWDMWKGIRVGYLLVTVLYVLRYKHELSIRGIFLQIVLYISAIFSLGFAKDLPSIFGAICSMAPVIVFFSTTKEFKKSTLDFITRGFAYILIPSMVLFLLSFVITLPNFGQIEHKSWDMYVYTNYFFFIKGQFYDIRFNSIFLEPGHLGMVISFLLFAYRFDMSKWEIWVLLIAELLTLSLAGYVLVAVAYVLSLISRDKSFLKFILSVLILLSSIYAGAKIYNDGNNLLNILIVSRLDYDSEKGISGNNRFSNVAEDYFEELISSDKIWFGFPESKYRQDDLGAGWKIFMIQRGLISLILFFLFYLVSARSNVVNRKYNMFFLILITVAFIQRSYPSWESWIIPFCCGMAIFQIPNKAKNVKQSLTSYV